MTEAQEPIAALILCPKCRVEMRLLGIERQSPIRDLYTFECMQCRAIEVRGLLVAAPA